MDTKLGNTFCIIDLRDYNKSKMPVSVAVLEPRYDQTTWYIATPRSLVLYSFINFVFILYFLTTSFTN